MSPRTVGLMLVFCAAVCWSLGGLGIKLIDADALAISGFRSLMAIPVLLLPIALSRQRPPQLLAEVIGRRFVWAGAASYALCVVCFVTANKLTTAANAILLQYTAPIYVVLLSRPLLGEPVHRLDVICALACLGGMVCFFADRLSASGWLGNIIAIISGLGFALLTLMLRLEQRRLGAAADRVLLRLLPLGTIVLGNVLTAVVGLPWMMTGAPRSSAGWLALILLGTVQIGLAYLLFALGVPRVRAVESMLMSMIEPVLNPIWVLLATGERPGTGALAGGAVILASVTIHGVLSGLRLARVPAPES
ncbi:MAG: EamA family transporter [Myxococcales bacterium]|nr:DMT family transporter [Myxococcota bacterium]MDW8280062.1 EamA family transporter [Myxococcales bacterium]